MKDRLLVFNVQGNDLSVYSFWLSDVWKTESETSKIYSAKFAPEGYLHIPRDLFIEVVEELKEYWFECADEKFI